MCMLLSIMSVSHINRYGVLKRGALLITLCLLERAEVMSERARGREIPSLVNTESRLDPNPAKWSGELTFP